MEGQILHYKIHERLGRGAMGEVYRATDTRLDREVALKFLPASYQYDPDRRERFFREARAASRLRSPNIAAIFDIGEHDGSSFIVMELVDGEPLSAKLQAGPLSVPDVVQIASQIADALDEAHGMGVVHRDIKPSNLMITGRGLVKVLDFGLAKIDGTHRRVGDPDAPANDRTAELDKGTVIGVVAGTVSYMSPEQALGHAVDLRSDLFSLGVVVYEMLTGRTPFEGASETQIIDAIVHQQPAAIARFNYEVPAQLEYIIRKALAKDPNFRYQTAREIYIDFHFLQRELEGERPVTGGIGAPTGGRLAEERVTAMLPAEPVAFSNPSAGLGGASSLASAPHPGAGLSQGLTRGRQPELHPANAVAVMTFSNITKEAADDWIGSGIAETVTADLKNINGVSVIGRERIYESLKNVASAELRELDEKFAIDIGRRLGAAWIVGGGYQRVGDIIRITARFVDVANGALIKTVKIDGKISEIFDLQDRIVYELTQGLNVQLAQAEIAEIERDETESVEAYEDYSRGIINLRLATRDSLDRSVHLLERAIEHDPNYASAWAALGAAQNLKAGFLGMTELSEKAIEYEKKALSLNPRLGHAHQWLGAAYLNLLRTDEAIAAIKEAINLDPNSAGAHSALARAYWVGKGMIAEGISELERSVALNPQSGYAFLQLSYLYVLAERYPEAEAAALKAVDMQERRISGTEGLVVVGAHTRMGYVFYRQNRFDDALREYALEDQFLASSDHALRDRALIELNQKMGAAYLKKGQQDDAERHFARALKIYADRVKCGADDPFTKYYVAAAHALQGDADGAIKLLQDAIAQVPAFNRVRARTDPDFDTIRSDPRFMDAVSEVGVAGEKAAG